MFNEERYQRMLSRVLAQYQNTPILDAILYAIYGELDEVEKVQHDLKYKRWINTGEGVQLDGIGEIVDRSRIIENVVSVPFFGFKYQYGTQGFGQARFRGSGESYMSSTTLLDEEYRKILWLKVFKNRTNSTTEETISAFKKLLNANRVILREIPNAKMAISIDRVLTAYEIAFLKSVSLTIYTGGVGIKYLNAFNGVSFFGFKHQRNAKTFGVGSFARTYII